MVEQDTRSVMRTAVSMKATMGSIYFLAFLIIAGVIVTGCLVEWTRLPIKGLDQTLNDQVGYISAARHWIDDGKLESSLIYPSVLKQNFRRNVFYMPGFYAELAFAFRVLGYSAIIARIPSLISYLIACGFVYWIARRMFEADTARYACALFAFFPLNLFFAFTAMAELPLVAAGLAAFGIFVGAPQRFRWWAGPIALALPVMFRETGVLLGVLMCTILFFENTEDARRHSILCGLLAGAVAFLLMMSPAGTGRASLWAANVLGRAEFQAVYSDAFALEQIPHSPEDWLVAVAYNFWRNSYELLPHLSYLLRHLISAGGLEGLALLSVLTGIPLGALRWRYNRDAFALGVALSTGLLFISVLCFYTVWSYRGIRSLLLIQPFVAILWGVMISACTRNRKAGLCILLASAILGVAVSASMWRQQRDAISAQRKDTSFLESVIEDRSELIVSPWEISLDYVNEHYPQHWSFIPANCPTMQLLDSRELIGTLILPVKPGVKPEWKACGISLKFTGEEVWRGQTYWIFQREQG